MESFRSEYRIHPADVYLVFILLLIGWVTSGSNWEKFKHIVKDSQKAKQENHNLKPHNKNRRKVNNTARPAVKNVTDMNSVFKPLDRNVDKNAITSHIAMDCEMVGIGDGTDSMIARVSIVNRHGVCIYDKYVKPTEPVTDYRTAVSGIRPCDIENGELFKVVQSEVANILKNRVLIGHALKHDLDVLFLKHPKRHIRDTSRYKQFRKYAAGSTPSLKNLASLLLGIKIQTGEHDSVEDAKAAMQLYLVYKSKWESELRDKK